MVKLSQLQKDRKISDLTEKECIDTLYHIHEWLQKENIHTNGFVG